MYLSMPNISTFVTASTATIMASKAAINLAGFTKTGIAAKSLASAWMSSSAIANGGGIAAGSTFSLLQSAGMTGSLMTGPVGAVVGVAALIVGLIFTSSLVPK
nr:unnamed protein product [Naegleria fowleri]